MKRTGVVVALCLVTVFRLSSFKGTYRFGNKEAQRGNMAPLLTVLCCVRLESPSHKAFMYCPSCGQQQISDEMRYCSRCGLALTGLMEWLAGGRPPLTAAEAPQVAPDSRRRKNIRRAGKLMFFAGALFPIFVMVSLAADEPGPLVIPFMLFLIALAWMLYARIFMNKTEPVKHQGAVQPPMPASFQTSTFGHAPAHGSLPPAATAPPLPNRGQVRTNELAQRPSVTEHTTRLLDNE